MYETILTPVLALIVWTLVMWLWMYATRIPAMQKAGINAAKMKAKSEMDVLPIEVRRIADNYNHLHEQPTVFYALAVYCHLVGLTDPLMIGLAWGYVALRVLHSLIQALWNFIPVRFLVFVSSTIVLVVMSVIAVLALF
ncbi:MAPEG family protein [Maricaulis sp.]|uniref:MAPEG family protein n=1 Tax=Maricaulis sp. TaxID=1486257 RepID=UPI003A92AC02